MKHSFQLNALWSVSNHCNSEKETTWSEQNQETRATFTCNRTLDNWPVLSDVIKFDTWSYIHGIRLRELTNSSTAVGNNF